MVGGRRAELDMQVRDPQRTVLFEVFQNVHNAELALIGRRVNLCCYRIFFCHSYLLWSKSFADSALLIEKPEKTPFFPGPAGANQQYTPKTTPKQRPNSEPERWILVTFLHTLIGDQAIEIYLKFLYTAVYGSTICCVERCRAKTKTTRKRTYTKLCRVKR